jgi:hypothetical protein
MARGVITVFMTESAPTTIKLERLEIFKKDYTKWVWVESPLIYGWDAEPR